MWQPVNSLMIVNQRVATLVSVVVCAMLAGIVTADDTVLSTPPKLTVKRCVDFKVSGKGDAEAWKSAAWISLTRRPNGKHDYTARFKMLYSAKGVYVLFAGSDQTLTATMQEDFLHLWNEDVFECFFWTDEKHPVYFEYEISPLGFELPILVPNLAREPFAALVIRDMFAIGEIGVAVHARWFRCIVRYPPYSGPWRGIPAKRSKINI